MSAREQRRLAREAANGQETLWSSAFSGDVRQLNALLASGWPHKDRADEHGYTILHVAAGHGSEALRSLLAAGVNKDAKTNDGLTALHVAAIRGNEAGLQVLIAAGCDKEALDENGATPLHPAAYYGHVSCVRALLAAGANKDAKDVDGATPLQLATRDNGNDTDAIPCAVLLAAWGADPLPYPTNPAWPMHWDIGVAVRGRLKALQPGAVAAARARLAAAPGDAEAAAGGQDAPRELVALLRAELAVGRIEKAFLGFREEALRTLAAAKASRSLRQVEYRTVAKLGREVAFREAAAAAAAAVTAAETALEEARERQRDLVELRTGKKAIRAWERGAGIHASSDGGSDDGNNDGGEADDGEGEEVAVD